MKAVKGRCLGLTVQLLYLYDVKLLQLCILKPLRVKIHLILYRSLMTQVHKTTVFQVKSDCARLISNYLLDKSIKLSVIGSGIVSTVVCYL